jgi:hypothetical protein
LSRRIPLVPIIFSSKKFMRALWCSQPGLPILYIISIYTYIYIYQYINKKYVCTSYAGIYSLSLLYFYLYRLSSRFDILGESSWVKYEEQVLPWTKVDTRSCHGSNVWKSPAMGRIESFIICEFHDISHGDQNSRAWQNRERLLDSNI